MPTAPQILSWPAHLTGTVIAGRHRSACLLRFAKGIAEALRAQGQTILPEGVGTPRLAIHFLAVVRIRPFRRKAQGTFVVSVVEVEAEPADLLKAAYPIWLSNLLIYLVNRPDGLKTYFVTLEQGYYQTPLMGQAMRTISGPSTSGCAPWQPLSW